MTRPSHHSSVVLVTDDQRIIHFVHNHICWRIQLISLIPFSISTYNDLTTFRITFPCNNMMIVIISNINRLIIINIDTPRTTELMWSISFSISCSNGNSILFPFCIWRNINRSGIELFYERSKRFLIKIKWLIKCFGNEVNEKWKRKMIW